MCRQGLLVQPAHELQTGHATLVPLHPRKQVLCVGPECGRDDGRDKGGLLHQGEQGPRDDIEGLGPHIQQRGAAGQWCWWWPPSEWVCWLCEAPGQIICQLPNRCLIQALGECHRKRLPEAAARHTGAARAGLHLADGTEERLGRSPQVIATLLHHHVGVVRGNHCHRPPRHGASVALRTGDAGVVVGVKVAGECAHKGCEGGGRWGVGAGGEQGHQPRGEGEHGAAMVAQKLLHAPRLSHVRQQRVETLDLDKHPSVCVRRSPQHRQKAGQPVAQRQLTVVSTTLLQLQNADAAA
mmetsp:Transcript_29697/g.86037  ORF Transcript_29697/g.86037 Transcript_29697/m.86037 type:complete len:296 (+) Transcript_29697:1812-2699(+)